MAAGPYKVSDLTYSIIRKASGIWCGPNALLLQVIGHLHMSLTETTANKDTENNTIASSLVQSCLNQCFATAIPHSSAGRRKYSFTFLSAEVFRGNDSRQNCLVYLPEYTAMISLMQRVCHAVLTQEK